MKEKRTSRESLNRARLWLIILKHGFLLYSAKSAKVSRKAVNAPVNAEHQIRWNVYGVHCCAWMEIYGCDSKKKIPHWHALCRSLVFAERSSVKRINARALTSTFGFSFDPVEDAWQCDSASCFWKNCEEWRVGTTRGWDWYIVHNRTNMHLSAQ